MNIDELIEHLYATAARIDEARATVREIRKEPRDQYALRDLLKVEGFLKEADALVADAVDFIKKAK